MRKKFKTNHRMSAKQRHDVGKIAGFKTWDKERKKEREREGECERARAQRKCPCYLLQLKTARSFGRAQWSGDRIWKHFPFRRATITAPFLGSGTRWCFSLQLEQKMGGVSTQKGNESVVFNRSSKRNPTCSNKQAQQISQFIHGILIPFS